MADDKGFDSLAQAALAFAMQDEANHRGFVIVSKSFAAFLEYRIAEALELQRMIDAGATPLAGSAAEAGEDELADAGRPR